MDGKTVLYFLYTKGVCPLRRIGTERRGDEREALEKDCADVDAGAGGLSAVRRGGGQLSGIRASVRKQRQPILDVRPSNRRRLPANQLLQRHGHGAVPRRHRDHGRRREPNRVLRHDAGREVGLSAGRQLHDQPDDGWDGDGLRLPHHGDRRGQSGRIRSAARAAGLFRERRRADRLFRPESGGHSGAGGRADRDVHRIRGLSGKRRGLGGAAGDRHLHRQLRVHGLRVPGGDLHPVERKNHPAVRLCQLHQPAQDSAVQGPA